MRAIHIPLIALWCSVLLVGCTDTEPMQPTPSAGFAERQSALALVGVVELVQLTSTTDCSGSAWPSLTASARTLSFDSDCDFGSGQNADRSTEVFLMDVATGEVVQLTDYPSPPTASQNSGLDASGGKVTFINSADLIPGQNTDLNDEIFLMNADGAGLIQLTFSTGDHNQTPALDYAGNRVVFTSSIDLLPGENVDESFEVFLIRADGSDLRQLTATPNRANSSDGRVTASGKRLFFRSDGDWLGTNPDFGGELFLMDIDGTNLTQVTTIAGGSGVNEIAVNGSGTRAIFSSTSDVVAGGNVDANSEIYFVEVRSGRVTQLTFTTGGTGCFTTAMSADGWSAAFSCDRDLVAGQNTDENLEIFLARLGPGW